MTTTKLNTIRKKSNLLRSFVPQIVYQIAFKQGGPFGTQSKLYTKFGLVTISSAHKYFLLFWAFLKK